MTFTEQIGDGRLQSLKVEEIARINSIAHRIQKKLSYPGSMGADDVSHWEDARNVVGQLNEGGGNLTHSQRKVINWALTNLGERLISE